MPLAMVVHFPLNLGHVVGEALEASLMCWESHEADMFLNYLSNVQIIAITMS